VLPNYPRYRDLAQRTRRGRGGAAAGVHVVFVGGDGSGPSDTWSLRETEALSEAVSACHSRAIHTGTEVHFGGRPRTTAPHLT